MYNRLFIKIISILFIVLFSIYFLGLVIFNMTAKAMINQIKDSAQEQISHYFSAFENDLLRLSKSQASLLADKDLSDFVLAGEVEFDYDLVRQINRIIDKLTNIADNNENVGRISVYLNEMDIRLNSRGYPSYDQKQDVPFGVKSKSGEISVEKDGLFIRSIPGYTLDPDGDIPYLVETKLSDANILKSIDQYKVNRSCKNYLFFNGTDYILTDDELVEGIELILTEENPGEFLVTKESGNDEKYTIIKSYSDLFDITYIQFIPEASILSPLQRIRFFYFLFSVLVVAAAAVIIVTMYYLIKKPVDILVRSCREVEKENFSIRIIHKSISEFDTVYNAFNKMVDRIDVLISQVYKQKILAQKAELRQLQSKINPHFLYNSFFVLRNCISVKKYGEAEEFCDMIGKYFQYITKSNDSFSSLADEIRHARLYADIQAMRFSERLRVEFAADPAGADRVQVPKVILQPLIENSFKYGLEDKEYDGLLRVSFECREEWIYIIVEDNGEELLRNPGRLDEIKISLMKENPDSSGLSNIYSRIHIWSGGNSTLLVSQSELGGLKVVIRLYTEKEN